MKTTIKLIRPASRWLPLAALCLAALFTGWLGCISSHAASPTIYQQPVDISVSLGASVTNSVRVTGGVQPYSFQWYFNGTALPGATAINLVINNIQRTNAGNYTFIVQDDDGLYATSRVARLEVDPTFTKITHGDIVQGEESETFMPYPVDYNDDGLLDLVIPGGFRQTSYMLIYENIGDGTFRRNRTNTLANTPGKWAMMTWGDYNNDGVLDCYAGNYETGVGSYFRGDGRGNFTRFLADRTWTVNGYDVFGHTAATGDYDRDGILDIVVGWWGNEATGSYGPNSLLHGIGDGRFEVVSNSPLAFSGTWPQDLSWVDINDDGYLDLFGTTSGYSTTLDWLYLSQGGTNFIQINNALTATAALTCGSAWGDLDNDGKLEVAICNFSGNNIIWRNIGNNHFEPLPSSPSNIGYSLVPALADYDNDGHLDLFISSYTYRNRLFHNNGDGSLSEIFSGSPPNEPATDIYGCTWGDFDNDGFMDLFVPGRHGVNWFYRNSLAQNGNTNHWLKIKPVGTMSNRSAIGAKVRVKATIGGKTFWQMRQIASQSHQLELTAHFGLGNATNIEVLRIEWPSGIVQELTNVAANQFLTITEPPKCHAPCLKNGNLEFTVTGNIGDRVELVSSEVITTPASNWVVQQSVTLTNRTQTICEPEAKNTTQKYYLIRRVP